MRTHYQNPRFNKKLYRKRRQEGLSGQETFDPVVGRHSWPDWLKRTVSKKALRKNSKRARKEQGGRDA